MCSEVQNQNPNLRHWCSTCMLSAHCGRDTGSEAARETKDWQGRRTETGKTDIGAELHDYLALSSYVSVSRSVLIPYDIPGPPWVFFPSPTSHPPCFFLLKISSISLPK